MIRELPDWFHRGEYIATRKHRKGNDTLTLTGSEVLSGKPHRKSGVKAPRLLTIRLSEEQYATLESAALEQDLPISTFARTRLMSALADNHESVISQFESAIRQMIKPELLRV